MRSVQPTVTLLFFMTRTVFSSSARSVASWCLAPAFIFVLAAHLARLQAEVVLAALTANFPFLQLVPSDLEWRPSVLVRGLKALPVAPRQSAGLPMESA